MSTGEKNPEYKEHFETLILLKDITVMIMVIFTLWNTASPIKKERIIISLCLSFLPQNYLFCIETNVKETHKTESADKN